MAHQSQVGNLFNEVNCLQNTRNAMGISGKQNVNTLRIHVFGPNNEI